MGAKVFKTLPLFLLVFSTRMALAADTPHSYQSQKNHFCNENNENGGERILLALDKLNNDKFQESERLKRELNDEIALMAIVKKHLQEKEEILNSLKESLDQEVKSTIAVLKTANKTDNFSDLQAKICKDEKMCSDLKGQPTSIRGKVLKSIADKALELYEQAAKPSSFNPLPNRMQSLYSDEHIHLFEKNAASVTTKDALKGDKIEILKNITRACVDAVSRDTNQTDQDLVNEFQEFCKNDSIYDLDNPNIKSKLAENIAKKAAEMNKNVEDLKDIHTSEEFNKIEVFKSYIAKKYLCMCANEVSPEVVVERTCYNYENHNQISAPTVFKLSVDINNVLYNMKFSQNISSLQNKCAADVDDRDLHSAVYNNCKKMGDNDPLKKICQIASGEQNKKDNEDAKVKAWADLNRDYWIKKDSSAKDGIVRTEKKKTWELIGEGIAPTLQTGIVPMWFTNYQIKANVNMLTQQALAEKQYNHTIDVYNQNPWMYGYPFLFQQTNFFPVYNPLSSGTSSNPYSAGTNSSTGYNFSP